MILLEWEMQGFSPIQFWLHQECHAPVEQVQWIPFEFLWEW